MFVGTILLFIVCVSAETWRWPDMATQDSERIDSKVAFIDSKPEINKRGDHENIQEDEIPFETAKNTEGFYNRPSNSGRFPVRVEGGHRSQKYESDGTLDSLQFCKCVTSPNCKVQSRTSSACGANKYLCCYKRPSPYPSDYFNEVYGERPMLFPNEQTLSERFPPRHFADNNNLFNSGQHNTLQSSFNRAQKPHVLVGPGGPTGIIGPRRPTEIGANGPSNFESEKPVLVGPNGPTGVIGPSNDKRVNALFNGPNHATVETMPSSSAQRGILIGPGGPTGIYGPIYNRPILVGPGGPTGIIGPRRAGILVGPGGPTGIIGPARYNRPSQGSSLLVGPGGPTGIIGPGRQILVGPGGPTGQIGPRSFGK